MLKQSVLYAALLAIVSSTAANTAAARECDLGTFSVPGDNETEGSNGQDGGSNGDGSSSSNTISGNQTNSLGQPESSLILHNFDIKFATFPRFDRETGTFVPIHAGDGDLPCQTLMHVNPGNSSWITSDKTKPTGDYYDAFTFTSFEPSSRWTQPEGQGAVRKYIFSTIDGEQKATLEFRLKAKQGRVELSATTDVLQPGFGMPQAVPAGTHVEVTANATLLAGTLLTVRYLSGDEHNPVQIGMPQTVLLPFGSYVSQIQQGWFAEPGFQGSGELIISSLPWTQSPD